MEKYQRVPREKDPMNSNEIRVSSNGAMKLYLNEATKLFEKENMKNIIIKATGKAIARAVTATEIIKRSIKGLHQITRVGSMPITDTYEPLEEGLDKVTHERIVSFLEITLSKEPLDEKNPGYQPPLDDEQLKEYQTNNENRGQVGAGTTGALSRTGGSRSGGLYRGRSRGGFYGRGGFFSRGRGGFRGRSEGGYRGGGRGGYGGGGFRDDYSGGYSNAPRSGFGSGSGYRGFRGGGGGAYRGFRGGFRGGRVRGFRGPA